MPTLLLANWKPILTALLLSASFAGGWHLKALSVEAAHAQELQTQINARTAAESEVNDLAMAMEKQQLAARHNEAVLNQRWRAELEKPHPVCQLSADVVGLLEDATGDLPR